MLNLFMVVLGCNLPNRFTEQHDVYFGIGESISSLKKSMEAFWPEAGDRLHIDSYRVVSKVGGCSISILNRNQKVNNEGLKLFFINLGGYKPNDMEEYHYKHLVVAKNMVEAVEFAKKDLFWKHIKSPHVDNKYGLDVDDAFEVEDMLSKEFTERYYLHISQEQGDSSIEDKLTIGYLKLSQLK